MQKHLISSDMGSIVFFRNVDKKNGHNMRRKRAQRKIIRPVPDLSSMFIRLSSLNMQAGNQTHIRYRQ